MEWERPPEPGRDMYALQVTGNTNCSLPDFQISHNVTFTPSLRNGARQIVNMLSW